MPDFLPDLHTIGLFLAGLAGALAVLLAIIAVASLARPTFEDWVEGQDR